MAKHRRANSEGEEFVQVQETSSSNEVVLQPASQTELKAWMDHNEAVHEGRIQDDLSPTVLYPDFPMHYVWDRRNHVWKKRAKGLTKERALGRMFTVAMSEGARFYLRLLLLNVPGSLSSALTHR